MLKRLLVAGWELVSDKRVAGSLASELVSSAMEWESQSSFSAGDRAMRTLGLVPGLAQQML